MEIYGWVGDSTPVLSTQQELIDGYQSLGIGELAAIHLGATLVLGILVLGVLPSYGLPALTASRRSPIISCCIGVPGALVLAGLLYTGLVMVGTDVGVFFGIPLVIIGVTFLPAWTALGFVSMGASLSHRLGIEKTWVWVVTGALISSLVGLAGPLGFPVIALAAIHGTGAGARALVSNGGFSQQKERVVPPANKV